MYDTTESINNAFAISSFQKQLWRDVFMTILTNVQHEPSHCNALFYEVIMEFHADTKLISHDSAFSLASILL